MRKIVIAVIVILSIHAVAKADTPAEPQTMTKENAKTVTKAVNVEKISVGTAIDNRELTGAASEFDTSVTKVYCWTHVTNATPPAKMMHVWYADDKKEAEVPLDIKYESMRTWSSKNVWPAKWKVEVKSDSGEVLGSTDFTVKAAAPEAASAMPKESPKEAPIETPKP